MSAVIWVLGRYRGSTPNGAVAWDIRGSFSDEAVAESACQERTDFIVPVTFDEAPTQQRINWALRRYPIADREA